MAEEEIGSEIEVEDELAIVGCASCEIIFAIPMSMNKRRREDGRPFYCPNGHSNVYGQSPIELMKKELEKAEARKHWAETNLDDERDKHAKTQKKLRRVVKIKWWRSLFRFD
jgi:hypothetical protein